MKAELILRVHAFRILGSFAVHFQGDHVILSAVDLPSSISKPISDILGGSHHIIVRIEHAVSDKRTWVHSRAVGGQIIIEIGDVGRLPQLPEHLDLGQVQLESRSIALKDQHDMNVCFKTDPLFVSHGLGDITPNHGLVSRKLMLRNKCRGGAHNPSEECL